MDALKLLLVTLLAVDLVSGVEFTDEDLCQLSKQRCDWNEWCTNSEPCEKPGFQPPNCTEPCKPGTCGQNCRLFCPLHCRGGISACSLSDCFCKGGCDDWYLPHACTELILEPPPPKNYNFEVNVISGSQVDLAWSSILSEEMQLHQYYGYVIAYTETIATQTVYAYQPHFINFVNQSYSLKWLNFNTEYTFQIGIYRGYDRLFEAIEWKTQSKTVKTHCIEPAAASSINVVSGCEGEDEESAWVAVSWEIGRTGCRSITAVEIRVDGKSKCKQTVTDLTSNEFIFTGMNFGNHILVIYLVNDEKLRSTPKEIEFTIDDKCERLRHKIWWRNLYIASAILIFLFVNRYQVWDLLKVLPAKCTQTLLRKWKKETPDDPFKPETPGDPLNPETPGDPLNPETPGDPLNPETPGDPLNPETPGDPLNPETPGDPLNPETPGDPLKH